MRIAGNEFSRSELAGAFGDLGTLIPFVVGYITVTRLDPQGVLLGFGLLAVATGFYFRTPMSVQPMKAIATVAVTHPGVVTPGGIFVSAVVTGMFWLGMGLTGAVSWIAAVTARPVVRGITLGLGLSFVLEGVRLMERGWLVAVPGALLTFTLLGRPRLPAMLALLAYGAGDGRDAHARPRCPCAASAPADDRLAPGLVERRDNRGADARPTTGGVD